MDTEVPSLRSGPDTQRTCDAAKPRSLAVVCNAELDRPARTLRAERIQRLGSGGVTVRADDPQLIRRRYPNLSFRVSEATLEAVERRAALRTAAESTRIKPGQVARELLEHALAVTDETSSPSTNEGLIEEVMAAALFARRAFQLFLSEHEGLAEKLLRASRAEVRRKKAGRTSGGVR